MDVTIQKFAVLFSLPSVIWNNIFTFLTFFDALNLLYSHRNFRYVIDETSFKFYFDNMDNVCSEVAWRMLLKPNFEAIIKKANHLFI